MLQERVDVMLGRLKDYQNTGEVLNLSCMYAAMTSGMYGVLAAK